MKQTTFISFIKRNDTFQGSLRIDGLINLDEDPEEMCEKASQIYKSAIDQLEVMLKRRKSLLDNHEVIPARLVWSIGNEIFNLIDKLASQNLIIDDTYAHLVRDLGVKRKWLEKVVILRRYIPKMELIPEDFPWGKLEKGTKKKAQELLCKNEQ